MNARSIREYAGAMRVRYGGASKKQKGALLAEFCATTGHHRKAAIRLLRQAPAKLVRRAGRKPRYARSLSVPLKQLWETANCICSSRLQPFLPELVKSLECHGALLLEPAQREALLAMSASTIDRLLEPYRMPSHRHHYTQSDSATAIKNQVPVRTFGTWQDEAPGALQADLVAHCGETAAEFFLYSLLAVDVHTSWIGLQPVWGKGQQRVGTAMHKIRQALPFALRELHTDNGGEFLNHLLFGWCQREGIAFTRGRPYKKNDQAYVEQKNWSVIRQWVGYDRYATKAAYDLLQRLYRSLCLYCNFFQPVSKLVKTERIGAKVKKQYDLAQTPYQRLLSTDVLDQAKRDWLARLYSSLNPMKLRAEMMACQQALWPMREHTVRARPAEEPVEDEHIARS